MNTTSSLPWLTILALLPLVGSLLLAFVRGVVAKQAALAMSLLTLAAAVVIALQYRVGGGMQLTEQVSWIRALGAHYALGLDGIGLTLVILVVVVTPVVIVAGSTPKRTNCATLTEPTTASASVSDKRLR